MGPPPPPPPPPPQSVLAPRGRTSANLPRRDNNPISSSSAKARQGLDAAALQHAAASLRKTVDGQQIRSDSAGLSNGSLAGSNQQLLGRDRPSGEDQRPLGGYQSIQQVYATPSRSVHSGAHSDLRGRTNPINDYNQQPPLQSSYPSYNAPTVTIQPPSEAPVYSNSNRTTDFHQTTYSIPRPYSSSQYVTSSPSSTQHYQSSNYTQPVSSRNVTVTKTYTYETPHQPAQTTTYKYHSESTQGNNNYINTYENTSGDRAVPTPTPNGYYSTPRSTSPYIVDARQRIHDFATSTPADVSHQTKETTSEYSLIRKSPSLQQRAPQPGTDFAKQLRDQGLTERQKFANRCQKTTVRDTQLPFSPEHIYQNSFRNDEVDHLVQKMSNTMHSGYSRGSYNICSVCNEEITNDKPGCTAMDRIYHIACFICKRCGSTLAGSSFYNIEGEALCEKDYNDSLERCNKCGQAIADRLLRACGGAFHTQCFTCSVCNVALDGVPFTVDKENQVHCVPCYHQRYAPRCAVCTTPIIPRDGEKESVRVVAMDKSFHPECYRCEDCGLQLSSKVEGAGCYPIDQHLLCRTCNSNRLRLISSA